VDFLVAQLHWGYEHELYPRPEQIGLAHRMAEMGVDLVVGHHPHVVQPMERYRTVRDPHRIVPIYYSLGNLVNPFSAPYLCRGGIARVEIVRGRLPGGTVATLVAKAELATVEQEVDTRNGTVRVVPGSDDEGSRRMGVVT
jgi:poly-gamma-glutamate synthesis protein (capsule biosynthesis protein)